MTIIRDGITRTVLLTRNYAIKFPTLRMWPENFLRGMLANMQERYWRKETGRDARLCPVLWCAWLGFVLIMPRVRTFEWKRELHRDSPFWNRFEGLPLDAKSDSLGWHNGKFVLVDYGS
jgi:hypothetical protein